MTPHLNCNGGVKALVGPLGDEDWLASRGDSLHAPARRTPGAGGLARVSAAGALGLALIGSQGCAVGPTGYSGTGSLIISGAPNGAMLAPQVAVLSTCNEVKTARGSADAFSVVAIGPGCVMDGVGGPDAFRPDPGTLCTLSFPDGDHALRVNEVSVQPDITSGPRDRAYANWSHARIEIGGADAKSGIGLLYSFSGSASDDVPAFGSCDEERPKHLARLPNACTPEEVNPEKP